MCIVSAYVPFINMKGTANQIYIHIHIYICMYVCIVVFSKNTETCIQRHTTDRTAEAAMTGPSSHRGTLVSLRWSMN